MTKAELLKQRNSLLKHVAELHSFILNIRMVALSREDTVYIRKTKGIGMHINNYKKKYPNSYMRNYNKINKKVNVVE